MSEPESVRVELAFEGGQSLTALVTVDSADELERAVGDGRDGTLVLDASDGRYSVVLARVVFVKRHARESRVGFGI